MNVDVAGKGKGEREREREGEMAVTTRRQMTAHRRGGRASASAGDETPKDEAYDSSDCSVSDDGGVVGDDAETGAVPGKAAGGAGVQQQQQQQQQQQRVVEEDGVKKGVGRVQGSRNVGGTKKIKTQTKRSIDDSRGRRGIESARAQSSSASYDGQRPALYFAAALALLVASLWLPAALIIHPNVNGTILRWCGPLCGTNHAERRTECRAGARAALRAVEMLRGDALGNGTVRSAPEWSSSLLATTCDSEEVPKAGVILLRAINGLAQPTADALVEAASGAGKGGAGHLWLGDRSDAETQAWVVSLLRRDPTAVVVITGWTHLRALSGRALLPLMSEGGSYEDGRTTVSATDAGVIIIIDDHHDGVLTAHGKGDAVDSEEKFERETKAAFETILRRAFAGGDVGEAYDVQHEDEEVAALSRALRRRVDAVVDFVVTT